MAQQTVKLYITKFGYASKESPSAVIDISGKTDVTLERYASSGIYSELFVGFSALPSSLLNKRLYSATATLVVMATHKPPTGAFLCPSAESFNPSTLVWTNRPAQEGDHKLIATDIYGTTGKFNRTFSFYGDTATATDLSALASAFLKNNSAFLYPSVVTTGATIGDRRGCRIYKTLEDGSAPYLEITYDDSVNVQSKITPTGNCPTSGYVNPRTARSFSWTFEKNDTYSCVGGFTQASAKLFWKTSTASTWNQVSASGSTQSLTVPANTFTANSTIQWYLQGTDNVGTTSTSSTYSFSTVAAAVVVNPAEPVNSVEDGTADITFKWNYTTADGFAPSAVDLAWQETGDSGWTSLLSNASWRTTYTAAANTFPAGEIQWRIRGYNIDGSAGSYSYASFVSIAAPDVDGLQATAVPYSTITWQAEGQQAFQIEANGKTYGPYFGADKSFTLPEYLPDGMHTIRIKVLGAYGMWSAWNEISVDIQNAPGDSVTLTGQANLDVNLRWETGDTAADFYIARDGNIIGHTENTFFCDRFTTGNHVYKVINRLPDGNYTESNQISRKVCLKNNIIAPLAGGEWLEIKFALKGQGDPVYEEFVEVTYDHFGGFEFPSATISGYRDINVSYSAAFPYFEEDKHRRFKALFGKPVVVKTRDGDVNIGILESWSRTPDKHYYTGYTFTIRRIDWEDYVDDAH